MQTKNDAGVHFGNVLIIGLGMIGGSFAKALKDRGLAYLYGADRRVGELTLGVSHGVIDEAVELNADAIGKMDIIVLATPVRAMEGVMAQIKPHLHPTTLVTDVGSTKGSVAQSAIRVFGDVPSNFIPSHPIAGAEKSGVLAANPNLFERHMAIVTPMAHSNPDQLDLLYRVWRAIGADVVSMDVEHHDHVLAASSHLPHLLAYTLVDALANADRSKDIFRFAAGGFRDFTRIASSDPTMWRDVFLANKDATLATLDLFTDRLADMRQAIVDEDGTAMFGVFTRAKSARDHFLRLLEQRNSTESKEQKPVNLSVKPNSVLEGSISLPGDKYLSHVALMMAALSDGISTLSNIQLVGDLKVTSQALRDMGVIIEECGNSVVRIFGVGRTGLKAPIAPINVHQSETSLYFLLPALAAQSFACEVIGEGEIQNLPMTALLTLLRDKRVNINAADADCLPFIVNGDGGFAELTGKGVLAQSPSAKLINTAEFLLDLIGGNEADKFNWRAIDPVAAELIKGFFPVNYDQNPVWQAQELCVPSDTQISLWTILSAGLLPGSEITVTNLALTADFVRVLTVLQASGLSLAWHGEHKDSATVRYSRLTKLAMNSEEVSLCQDFLPMLVSASVFAEHGGEFELASSLPYYLEDRLVAVCDAIRHLGVDVQMIPGVSVSISNGVPFGGQLDSAGDADVVFALLLISARAAGNSIVQDCRLFIEAFPEWEAFSGQLGFHCQLAG